MNKNYKFIYFCIIKLLLIIGIVCFYLWNGNFNFLKYYDGSCYIKIAKYGYNSNKLYAFFPLYPLLIRLFFIVFKSYIFSGLLINLIISFVNFFILRKMVDDKKIMLYIYSPILIFFSVIYTESLFLMLTLLSYCFYRDKRYILCALCVGLSILTRNTGVLLFIAILIDYFWNMYKSRKVNIKELLILIIIPVILGSVYPLYLFFKTNNFLYFIDVQYKYWGRVSSFFIFGFINDIKVLIRENFHFFHIYIIIQNWFWTVYMFYLCIKIYKKDKISSLYGILSIIVFLSSYRDINKWMTIASISLFRYIWGLYPIYLYSDINRKKVFDFMIRVTCFSNIILYFMGVFVG